MRSPRVVAFVLVMVVLMGCARPTQEEFQRQVDEAVQATVQASVMELEGLLNESYLPEAAEMPQLPTRDADSAPVVGASNTRPVPLGQSAKVPTYDGLFDVQIAEVVRGDSAATIVKRLNPSSDFDLFADELDEGMEWMLVRMKGTCIDGGDGTGAFFGQTDDMTVYSLGRAVPGGSEFTYTRPPDPRLWAQYLTGAQIDGWVVLKAYDNDPSPLLYVTNGLNSQDGVWFALSK